MRKHVGFLIMNIQNSGGTERVTTIIANKLHERGFQVSIISCREGEYTHFPISEGVELLSLHGEQTSNPIKRKLVTFSHLKELVRKEKIDVMIAVDVALYIYLLPLQIRGYCKCIAWEHFNYFVSISSMAKLSRKLAARYADSLVVLGEADYVNYKKHCNKIKNIICIYNPLSMDISQKSDISKKVVVSIGRLSEEKGFDLLIQIWEKIEHRCPDWELKIYGDGPLRNGLQKMIDERKLENIHLCGYAEKVEEKYLDASIFALSSRYEGFGMVLLEAQAKGLPCISFDCKEGPRQIITEGVNGFLVPEGDMEQYAEKLLKLIQDEKLRNEFALNSGKDLKKYDVEEIVERWEKVL